MGQGRDLARAAAGPEGAQHHEVLENFRDQLLVALLKRLANRDGAVDLTIAEVDATGDSVVHFAVRPGPAGQVFHFEVRKKQ